MWPHRNLRGWLRTSFVHTKASSADEDGSAAFPLLLLYPSLLSVSQLPIGTPISSTCHFVKTLAVLLDHCRSQTDCTGINN